MRARHYLLAGACFVLGLLLAPLWHQPAGGQAPAQPAPGKVGKYQVSMSAFGQAGSFYVILCDTETGDLWLHPNTALRNIQWQPLDSPVHKKT
jgi:hypothetical protein